MKKNNLEITNEIIKKENKKLYEENKKLKIKNEMLELINFHLMRKLIFDEKGKL